MSKHPQTLVERLRDDLAMGNRGPLQREAADEIEQLKACLDGAEATGDEMAEKIERLEALVEHLENYIAADQRALHGVAISCEKAEAQRDELVRAGELAIRVFGEAPGLEDLAAAIEQATPSTD